jgi:ribonuclease I
MQSSTGGTSGAPACVSNAATPWLCTRAAPSHTSLTRHTRKGATREMTGRASDGSDSYSYSCMWSVAVCGSAISGENSCAAEGGAKGWSGYHGEA